MTSYACIKCLKQQNPSLLWAFQGPKPENMYKLQHLLKYTFKRRYNMILGSQLKTFKKLKFQSRIFKTAEMKHPYIKKK